MCLHTRHKLLNTFLMRTLNLVALYSGVLSKVSDMLGACDVLSDRVGTNSALPQRSCSSGTETVGKSANASSGLQMCLQCF